MRINYLEEEFQSKTLFKDVNVFDPSYIPSEIHYRENELILLSKIFLSILKNPSDYSKKVLIEGNVGVGKTLTTKIFGEMLKKSANIRNIKLIFLHINCRLIKTGFLILKTVINAIDSKIPTRGLSQLELYNIISRLLEAQQSHLVLVLDELDFLINNDPSCIYNLTRSNEMETNQMISLIGIMKDTKNLNVLDEATLSTLKNEVVKFKNYSKEQIINILQERIKLGLQKDVISDETLEIIAEITSEEGDLRLGLKIIKNSCYIAEQKGLKKVLPEHIRTAASDFNYLSRDTLLGLKKHELLFLKALINCLLNSNYISTSFTQAKEEYFILCRNNNIEPRSNSQLWKYSKNLEKLGIVNNKILNKEIRGRKIECSINKFPLNKLKEIIDYQINTL